MITNLEKPQRWIVFILLGAILVLGIYARCDGVREHVTYIDEMFVLEHGEFFSTAPQERDASPIEFVKPILFSKEVSYAPLQLLFTWALVEKELLTPESLYRSRLPSAVFACLTIGLFLFAAWKIAGGITPAVALVTGLFSFELIQITNAKQNHCYSVGVFATLVILLLSARLLRFRGITEVFTIQLLMLALNFAQFQVAVVTLACLAGCALSWAIELRERSLPRIACLLPGGLGSCVLLLWIAKLKPGAGIPWWVIPWEFHGGSLTAITAQSLRRFLDLTALAHLFAKDQKTDALAVVGFFFIAVGISRLKEIRFREKGNLETDRFLILQCVLVLVAFYCLYYAGKIALGPTRHVMAVLPLILLLELAGLRSLEERLGETRRLWLRFAEIGAGILIVVVFATAYPRWAKQGRESLDASVVAQLIAKYDVHLILANTYDFAKVRTLLGGRVNATISPCRDSKDFPSAKFLLIGQFPDNFPETYRWDGPTKFEHHLVYRDERHYGIEPVVRYWDNRTFIFLLMPRSGTN